MRLARFPCLTWILWAKNLFSINWLCRGNSCLVNKLHWMFNIQTVSTLETLYMTHFFNKILLSGKIQSVEISFETIVFAKHSWNLKNRMTLTKSTWNPFMVKKPKDLVLLNYEDKHPYTTWFVMSILTNVALSVNRNHYSSSWCDT